MSAALDFMRARPARGAVDSDHAVLPRPPQRADDRNRTTGEAARIARRAASARIMKLLQFQRFAPFQPHDLASGSTR